MRTWPPASHARSRFPLGLVLLMMLALPLAGGVAHAAWPRNPAVNLPICTAAADQQSPTIATDGAGGAIVTWYDRRSGNSDIYAQHALASGAVDGGWPGNGPALCTALRRLQARDP